MDEIHFRPSRVWAFGHFGKFGVERLKLPFGYASIPKQTI
jgi:hypothetical protein